MEKSWNLKKKMNNHGKIMEFCFWISVVTLLQLGSILKLERNLLIQNDKDEVIICWFVLQGVEDLEKSHQFQATNAQTELKKEMNLLQKKILMDTVSIGTAKPVLSSHSKIDKTKVLMANCSFMKVKSIAECSPWSILQYFWPALSNNWIWKPIFGLVFEWPLKTKIFLHLKF